MADSDQSSASQTPAQMAIQQLLKDLSEEVIGQHGLILRMLIALLAEGHLLVVGAPGLAKTTAVKALANRLEGEFHRIQFTPDLLPSDITGTEIYRAETGSFEFQKGPLFHHFILADEINRAPAKVQSALLEAMAEYQVTVGQVTYPMPELFLVMATQNPIEQEGTYSLPEAQLDRFIMEVNIDYPSKEDEQKVLALVRRQRKLKRGKLKPSNLKLDNSKLGLSENTNQLNQQVLFAARDEVFELHFSDALERYVVELIAATRNPAPYDPSLAKWIRYGASPRGSIALEHCARAHAWLKGRDYVSPEDIHAIAENVLRHRIILSYEAVAEGVTVEEIISSLLKLVPVP